MPPREVRLPGRRGIVVRPGFDPHTLLDLVTTLERGVPPAGALEALPPMEPETEPPTAEPRRATGSMKAIPHVDKLVL